MNPPARESVKRITPRLWTLGTAMMCVKISTEDTPPLSTVCAWKDGNSVFHLLPRDESPFATLDEGDAAIDRIQECGTGGSVWGIGSEAICKVKGWREDRQLEATTIAFVRDNCPSVPVPEVLYSWIDEPINRTFLILRRIHNRMLNTAWPELSAAQRLNVTNKVAQHCSTLSRKTSLRYETVSGHGVLEYGLMGTPPASNPTWLPMVLGPFSADEMKRYMSRMSSAPVPDFHEPFRFYHPDLGPTNILVSNDGDRITIIDWEAAGYFPSFWVATKPVSSWAFRLSYPGIGDEEKNGWSELLVGALEERGFECLREVYKEWSDAKIGHN